MPCRHTWMETNMMKIRQLPNDDNSCGWYHTLPPPGPSRVLTGRVKAHRVVVGAGFTGLACARRLAQLCPDDQIVLVDAQPIGYGTSGRNMGFAIDLPHKGDLASDDMDRKLTIMRLNRQAIAQLEEIVTSHRIDCQWSHAGKFQGAVGERGVGFLEQFEAMLRDVGEPYTVYDRQQASEILGTTFYERVVHTPGSVLMQPAALVRGLARSLPENVMLFENSPVVRFGRHDGSFQLETRHGLVTAEQVLMCTDAFTPEFGYMSLRMLPIMTFASMTAPLSPEDQRAYSGTYDWGLTPADHAGTTVRMTQDKRLLIRNTYDYVPKYHVGSERLSEVRQEHRDAFIKRFPALAHVPFEYTWGGVTNLSRDFSTFFGKVDEGVFGSFCHNGVGVARGTISGKLLADLALGASSKELADMQKVSGMPPRNPPDPFLGIGVRSRLKIASWISRNEI